MPLRIDGVSKRIRDTWVVRDVSLEIADGEIFGIFGPAGSGRSELLQLISGEDRQNAGSISLDGRQITGGSEDILTISRPRPSFWKVIRGDRGGEDDFHESSKVIEETLSRKPRVLVLSTILAGLDPNHRGVAIRRIQEAVRDQGVCVIFASSDFDEILKFCDRAVVMNKGDIVQSGSPKEIYEEPSTAFVAAVTGRNNLVEARRLSSSKADLPEFQTIAGGLRLFAQKQDRASLGALNQNVTLAIRPEHLSISFGASFPEDNLLRAVITSTRFLGPTTLVTLHAQGLTLEALVLRLVGLNPGDECMIGLPPDRIRILSS